jgi:hypothetical protein
MGSNNICEWDASKKCVRRAYGEVVDEEMKVPESEQKEGITERQMQSRDKIACVCGSASRTLYVA